MELQEEAGGCKGKIGKRGNKVLIESWATEETCKAACLEEKGCKFATLRMKGKPSKWQCASYKKCKLKKNKKYITFKKSKAKAPKPSPEPTPPPTVLPALPSKYVSMQPLPYVDLNTARSGASVGSCTQMNAYLHTDQQPPLTADNEPSTCESESAPCCRFFNRCDNHGVVDNQHGNGLCLNGDKNYRIPGESVTITRKGIGEPLQSRHLASVIAAGAGEDVPWPNFVLHAVGLQYCAAKSAAQLDDAFWSWLEARPELLLTLAATAYPVQAKIWENLQRFWQESEFRAAAESYVWSNPKLDRIFGLTSNVFF